MCRPAPLSFGCVHIHVGGVRRWWLLPPQFTYLFVDQFGQVPRAFVDMADTPRAEERRAEGRKHLIEVDQVIAMNP